MSLAQDREEGAWGALPSHVFERNGTLRNAHEHREVAVLDAPASETNGIEATSVRVGSKFPYGMLVVMNSDGRNFLLLPWPAELT